MELYIGQHGRIINTRTGLKIFGGVGTEPILEALDQISVSTSETEKDSVSNKDLLTAHWNRTERIVTQGGLVTSAGTVKKTTLPERLRRVLDQEKLLVHNVRDWRRLHNLDLSSNQEFGRQRIMLIGQGAIEDISASINAHYRMWLHLRVNGQERPGLYDLIRGLAMSLDQRFEQASPSQIKAFSSEAVTVQKIYEMIMRLNPESIIR